MQTFHFFAPGRVNIIGEHIDYNGGLVFPTAISLGIAAKMTPNLGTRLYLNSKGQNQKITIDLAQPLVYSEADGWGNYVKGVLQLLQKKGIRLYGGHLYLESTLPIGAGLSSSACLEVLIAHIFTYLAGVEMDKIALAQLCQKAENDFVGVQCGIMDQFAVAMGKTNQAMLLNCENLAYEYVPFELEDCVLMIMNSNKKRALADSKYNERKAECDAALALIKKRRYIKNLCEATLDDIARYIKNPILKKRAKHVITENERVKQAKIALEQGDLWRLGRLLNQSHFSLQHDYEVTGFELDVLAEESIKVDGCLGSRMTGAGFGGCVIALVQEQAVTTFRDYVTSIYHKETGLTVDFYDCQPSEGVQLV